MARANLCRDTKKEKQQERYDYIRSIIDGETSRYGLRDGDVAAKALMKPSTFASRKDNPGLFRLEELYALMDILDVKIVFVRKKQPV